MNLLYWAAAIGLCLAYLTAPAILDSYLEERVNERAAMKLEKVEMEVCVQGRRDLHTKCYAVFNGGDK